MEKSLNPLVSIGVPTYNRPITLDRTLNCLVNQTYSNLEIIVSDNCSTDLGVQCIMDQFISDNRIKYYKQPVNNGIVFNFNYVLEKTTGDFIMRLADDDWLDLNYIESCVTFLLNNPDYSAAYGSAKLYNNQNKYILDDVKTNMEQPDSNERVKHYFRNVLYNGTYYGLIRRENSEILKVTNNLADDWLVVARIAYKGKFKLLDSTNCYLTHGGSSQSFENLVRTLKLPDYIKHIPYLTVCINIIKEIIWGSSVYKDLNFIKRVKLGFECSHIIYKRFKVWMEVKKVVKKGIIKISKIPGRVFKLILKRTGLKFGRISHERIFTDVYKKNLWGTDKGNKYYSGSGSDLRNSASYIILIRDYIIQNNIKTLVDLGCGDFRIGKEIIRDLDLNYIGVDVVKSLIDFNNKHYSNPDVKFMKLDITKNKIPEGDLCLVRQVLQHLSNQDILKVLQKTTKFNHLIITEHLPRNDNAIPNIDKAANSDIRYTNGSGVYLDKPPFNQKIRELQRVEPDEHPSSAIVTFKILK